MTTQEERQQKAMLLLECHEASKRLASLEERATRLAQKMAAVSEWLGRFGNRKAEISDRVYNAQLSALIVVTEDEEITAAMNFPEVQKLTSEIKDARNRLQELSRRKEALGLA